jgi:transposase
LVEHPPPNSVVISFDEKAKIAIKEYGGHIWTKDKRPRYPARQHVKGLLEMVAGLNIHSGEIHYWFHDWKNSFIIIHCLERLLAAYPGKEVYVILDNWKAHKSYEVRAWLAFHPRMHLVYLPLSASWLNHIERVFSRLARDVLHNSCFQTVMEAIHAIDLYFQNEPCFCRGCS